MKDTIQRPVQRRDSGSTTTSHTPSRGRHTRRRRITQQVAQQAAHHPLKGIGNEGESHNKPHGKGHTRCGRVACRQIAREKQRTGEDGRN